MVAVGVLTAAVVYIAHWIGLPFWWERSPAATICLVIAGYWLLINVVFHYYMAVTTKPGVPPEGQIFDAVRICKKCITPKPSRTHHCSVCNKCILKMDHHCRKCIGEHLQVLLSNRVLCFLLQHGWTTVSVSRIIDISTLICSIQQSVRYS